MKEHSSHPSVNKFEAMKAEWRATDRDIVEHNLNDRFKSACIDLAEELMTNQADQTVISNKTRYLGLIISAQYDFLTLSNKNNEDIKMVSWTGLARNKIEEFVAEDPDNRKPLLQTTFFDSDLQNLRKLRKVINAYTQPAGVYDLESLSAGVALGEITISNRSSAPDSQE